MLNTIRETTKEETQETKEPVIRYAMWSKEVSEWFIVKDPETFPIPARIVFTLLCQFTNRPLRSAGKYPQPGDIVMSVIRETLYIQDSE